MKLWAFIGIVNLAVAGLPRPIWAQCGFVNLTASDPSAGDVFGSFVAVHEDRILVSAPLADPAGAESGAAYIFEREGTSWNQVAKLVAADGAAGDEFGYSVSVHGDWALIGARRGDGVVPNSGSAYFFQRSESGWVQAVELAASDGAVGDDFGFSVAVYDQTAFVGAPLDDDLAFGSGAVYVFEFEGGSWVQTAKLLASDGDASNDFGFSVSLFEGVALIGAPQHYHPHQYTGAAYLFERSLAGVWGPNETAELLASDGSINDYLGWRVAVLGDLALASARGDVIGTGSAYLFERTAPGAWGPTETIKFTASDGDHNDLLGPLALTTGNVLLGACGDDDSGSGSGSAYFFAQAGCTTWSPNETLKLVPADGMGGDCFGGAVALSGSVFVIGAGGDDASGLTDSGSVYVLSPDIGTPYCFGFGGACPCGNAAGVDEGCANSSGAGAHLCATGTERVCVDDASLHARGLLPGQPALLFAGQTSINGGGGDPFGDGLRCAGTNVRRLGVRVPDASGGALWGPGLRTIGGWAAGDTRFFQGWYRDPAGSPCSSGFNLTNGVQVKFEL